MTAQMPTQHRIKRRDTTVWGITLPRAVAERLELERAQRFESRSEFFKRLALAAVPDLAALCERRKGES